MVAYTASRFSEGDQSSGGELTIFTALDSEGFQTQG